MPPSIYNFDHLPVQVQVEGVPAPEITSATAAAAYTGLPCRVTVQVEAVNQDLDGTLFWATAGGAFNEVALTADGTTLTGDIPGQPVGTSVEWYVEVRDSDEQSDVYPEGAPDTLEEIVFVDPAAAAVELVDQAGAHQVGEVGHRPVVAGVDEDVFPQAVDAAPGVGRLAGHHLDHRPQQIGAVPIGPARRVVGKVCQHQRLVPRLPPACE